MKMNSRHISTMVLSLLVMTGSVMPKDTEQESSVATKAAVGLAVAGTGYAGYKVIQNYPEFIKQVSNILASELKEQSKPAGPSFMQNISGYFSGFGLVSVLGLATLKIRKKPTHKRLITKDVEYERKVIVWSDIQVEEIEEIIELLPNIQWKDVEKTLEVNEEVEVLIGKEFTSDEQLSTVLHWWFESIENAFNFDNKKIRTAETGKLRTKLNKFCMYLKRYPGPAARRDSLGELQEDALSKLNEIRLKMNQDAKLLESIDDVE